MGRLAPFRRMTVAAAQLRCESRRERRKPAGPVRLALVFLSGAVGIAAWAHLSIDGWLAWTSCAFGWVLLALTLIDVRAFLLPDALTLPLVPAGLIVAYAIAPENLPHHLLGSVGGFAAFAAVRAVHRWLRHREGLGFGDVKLMAALGAWLSWQALPSVVLIAAAAGLTVTLLQGLGGRSPGWDRPLPFGAYLSLAAWLVWLHGPLAIA